MLAVTVKQQRECLCWWLSVYAGSHAGLARNMHAPSHLSHLPFLLPTTCCLAPCPNCSTPQPHKQTQQVMAQMDGSVIKLHLTPLRGSRALALRHLAYTHKVDMSSLVLVCCAKDVAAPGAAGGSSSPSPAGPAKFACSDMEDLLGGVQGVLVVPPPAGPAAEGGAAGDGEKLQQLRGRDGFTVDLELYTHDARLQLLPGI